MISIQLNSFVHRVADKQAFIALAERNGCKIQRIRRSRNWRLSGTEQQLNHLKNLIPAEADRWIRLAVEKALPVTFLSPADYIQKHPNTTLNQLVKETGCTVAEARKAIDSYELLD